MTSPSGRAVIRGLLRPLLPFLLASAAAEMLISRVLLQGGIFWVRRLSANTVFVLDQMDTLAFTFSIIMALGLLVLLGFLSLRLRFWPAPLPTWVGPGLMLFAAWSLLQAFLPGVAPVVLYHAASLLLALAMLSSYFGISERGAPRGFSVLLSASLTCGAYAAVAEAVRESWTLPWKQAALQSGELLALGCGAVAPALLPREGGNDRHAFPRATLAAIAAGLYLLLEVRAASGLGEEPSWHLGWMRDLPFPAPFTGLVYAGVLFLFLYALFRALGAPRWRLRGYGLAFLFLAGIHYRIAYQHVLGLIGLVLLTGGAPAEEPSEPAPQAATAGV